MHRGSNNNCGASLSACCGCDSDLLQKSSIAIAVILFRFSRPPLLVSSGIFGPWLTMRAKFERDMATGVPYLSQTLPSFQSS